jgi:hypothetical protein
MPTGGLACTRRGLGAVPRRRTQGRRRGHEGTAAMAHGPSVRTPGMEGHDESATANEEKGKIES